LFSNLIPQLDYNILQKKDKSLFGATTG